MINGKHRECVNSCCSGCKKWFCKERNGSGPGTLCRECFLNNMERPFFGRGKYNGRNCFCKMCRKVFVRKKWEHGGFCKDCIDELFDNTLVCGRCNQNYTKENGHRGVCCVCIDDLMKMTGKVNYDKYNKYRIDPYEKWIQTEECPRCYVCEEIIKIDKYRQIPGITCNYRSCRLQFHKHVIFTLKECLSEKFGVSKDMQNYICKFIEP